MRGKLLRLEGRVFGELTVIARVGRSPRGYSTWLCRCSCGEEIVVASGKLQEGKKRVCRRTKAEHRVYTTHIAEHQLTWRSWCRMRERCRGGRENYGGRGITVCERWGSFKSFLADMGERPGPEFSIERIDVNGDYAPENCKWGTDSEQRRNKRHSVYVEWQGRRRFLRDLCGELGLRYSVVAARYRVLGWSLEDALTKPVKKYRGTGFPSHIIGDS